MKFFHLSDLHIGKRLCEVSLGEDQRVLLRRILALCETHRPDALVIAGDIYDKTVPPAESVGILDEFLTGSAELGIPVLLISGNHDSPERLDYGSRLLEARGIYLEGIFRGAPRRVTLEDAFGPVDFWLLPFVKGASARPFFPDREIKNEQDAVQAALSAIAPDPARRNVLVAHQFVTGSGAPLRSDSETVSVGGSDNVDASLFDAFDYVALGHLHIPQQVGRETVRYCGSPLKYSFSEWKTPKSVTMVELREKGDAEISQLPLTPLRDLRQIEGPLEQLLDPDVVSAADPADYLRVILTDGEEQLDPLERLRQCYPNLLRLDFRRRGEAPGLSGDAAPARPLPELFADFYEMQQGAPLEGVKKRLADKVFGETAEEN